MKLNCIVVDDDFAYCELVSSFVEKHEKLELAGKYTEPEVALKHLSDESIHLMFLDMEMPGINGLELVKSLPDPPYVIFITSYKDFAIESYEVDAIDYILKPIEYARFCDAVNKAVERIETKMQATAIKEAIESIRAEQDYFFIRSDAQYIKIFYSDVLYVEAFTDFTKIYTPTQTYMTLVNLKNIEASLPDTIFIRTHRSYLVNVQRISAMDASEIMLGERKVPIGLSFKDKVHARILGNKLIKRN